MGCGGLGPISLWAGYVVSKLLHAYSIQLHGHTLYVVCDRNASVDFRTLHVSFLIYEDHFGLQQMIGDISGLPDGKDSLVQYAQMVVLERSQWCMWYPVRDYRFAPSVGMLPGLCRRKPGHLPRGFARYFV